MKAGWIKTTVGAAFSTATGGTPPKSNLALYGNFLPLVKPPELCDAELDAAEDGLSEEGVGVARIAPPNSILVSCIGNLGKIGLNVVPVAFNQQINAILPDASKANHWFMFYQTLSCSFKDQLESLASGTTVPIVNKSKFNSVEIVLPPLPEQHRIAAILDEAFDGIATAKANAEKNLQNARALFESHLQSVFTERGDGWVEKPLGDIAEVQSGGTPTVSKKEFWNGDIPWYSSGELNKTFTTNPERHITGVGLNNSNAKLFPKGALLVGMYDTAALKMSILDRDGAFNQAIAGIKPNDRIEVEFILHAINAEKPKLLLERRGVRQKNLSLGKIKEISVPLPAPEVQRDVVASLRQFALETQRLESLYQQKLTALDDLKKSLLHQAFSGAL
jgi:type I restriction enzyme S subunit